MDKGLEYTFSFFQRRHTDGQQIHEKMLNITNCLRNANQNYNEVSHTLKKKIVTYSSILAWEIPWTEELGELQSNRSQKS